MPDKTSDTIVAAVMEQLVAEGPQAMAQVMTALMNLAMRLEREQFLAAGHDERVPERRGYANGTKPKLIDSLAGTAEPGCAQDCWSGRAILPPGAGAWPTLVPRRHAGDRGDVCVRCLDPRCRAGHGRVRFEEPVIDPGQSGAAKLLIVRGCGDPAPHSDDELQAWRCRTLGEVRYLFLDASSREIAARWRRA